MHVTHIGVEGTVSQIFVLCLSFHFIQKKQVTFYIYCFEYFILDFIENQLGLIKILRHSSLNSNALNTHVKFQAWVMHIKRDIRVQKIKLKKIIFKYIRHSFSVSIVYFLKSYIIRKLSFSV